jgi:hypothetical protein
MDGELLRCRAADLRFVEHMVFGAGVVFGERQAVAGNIADVYFIADAKARTILIETLAEYAQSPELSKAQRKAVCAAVAEYRKTHRTRVRQTPDRPRRRRPDTKPEWRRTFEFAGSEDELEPVDEEVSAAE